uniref:DUF4780 domain-containing protein n=2 Tax=Rhodnius TaxID=13248 RepID=T1IBZ3_RHOPR
MRGSVTGDRLFPSYSWERDYMNTQNNYLNSTREVASANSLNSNSTLNVKKPVLTVVREDTMVYSVISSQPIDEIRNLAVSGENALMSSLSSNTTQVKDKYSQDNISKSDYISITNETIQKGVHKRPSGATRRKLRKLRRKALLEDSLTTSHLPVSSESCNIPAIQALPENLIVSNFLQNEPNAPVESFRNKPPEIGIATTVIHSTVEGPGIEHLTRKLSGAARRRLRRLKQEIALKGSEAETVHPKSSITSDVANKTLPEKLYSPNVSQNISRDVKEVCQNSFNDSSLSLRSEPVVWDWSHGKNPKLKLDYFQDSDNISNHSFNCNPYENAPCSYNFGERKLSNQSILNSEDLALQNNARRMKETRTLAAISEGSCPNGPVVWDWSHQSNPVLFESFFKKKTEHVSHQNYADGFELTNQCYLSLSNESVKTSTVSCMSNLNVAGENNSAKIPLYRSKDHKNYADALELTNQCYSSLSNESVKESTVSFRTNLNDASENTSVRRIASNRSKAHENYADALELTDQYCSTLNNESVKENAVSCRTNLNVAGGNHSARLPLYRSKAHKNYADSSELTNQCYSSLNYESVRENSVSCRTSLNVAGGNHSARLPLYRIKDHKNYADSSELTNQCYSSLNNVSVKENAVSCSTNLNVAGGNHSARLPLYRIKDHKNYADSSELTNQCYSSLNNESVKENAASCRTNLNVAGGNHSARLPLYRSKDHKNYADPSELTNQCYSSLNNESVIESTVSCGPNPINAVESKSPSRKPIYQIKPIEKKELYQGSLSVNSINECCSKSTTVTSQKPDIRTLNDSKKETNVEHPSVACCDSTQSTSSLNTNLKKNGNQNEVISQKLRDFVLIATDDYPQTKITEELQNQILLTLMSKIDSVKPKKAALCFIGYSIHMGALKISCADLYSKEWLQRVVPSCIPWTGAKLRVIGPEILLKPIRVSVRIPDRILTSKQILSYIALQNKDVDTSGWKVEKAKEEEGGQQLIIVMDESSWAAVMYHKAALYVNHDLVTLERL